MAVRKERGVSHDKLAEMTGLSRATISFVENHKRNPTLITCLKIAKALDVDLADIMRKGRK
ncbi:MAG: helix-turn-helix transcriptional regulator [Alphaproteobacteria bacterium]|nr:helix-turn-helix transcriptional regulator [Alphaproteobacteria bacterium]